MTRLTTEAKIQAVLYFRGEPTTYEKLSKLISVPIDEIKATIPILNLKLADSGLVIVFDKEKAVLGTSPEVSDILEEVAKDDLNRDLGKAGLETLSIILYKAPIAKKEIDYIRCVNSGFILRNLMVRGLVERDEVVGLRGFVYKPTLDLLSFMGIKNVTELPEYEEILAQIENFSKKENKEKNNEL